MNDVTVPAPLAERLILDRLDNIAEVLDQVLDDLRPHLELGRELSMLVQWDDDEPEPQASRRFVSALSTLHYAAEPSVSTSTVREWAGRLRGNPTAVVAGHGA